MITPAEWAVLATQLLELAKKYSLEEVNDAMYYINKMAEETKVKQL